MKENHCESRTILLVDDDPVIRLITRQTLSHAGYGVEEASDGIAAQARLSGMPPCLILLDVVMPNMDGYAFCAWLRAQPEFARIPVLMMTGLEDDNSIQRAFEVGATDFVAKPVNPAILVQRVRFLLRASRALEELAESRESLAAAQRIARLGSWHADFLTRRVNWSDEVFRILEIDPQRYPPNYGLYLTRVHPEDKERVLLTFQEAQDQGKSYDMAHRLLMPDGRVKWVNERGRSLLGANGEPVSAAGTIQDITERQQSRETIRYLSSFDNLTGLPNRLLFEQQVDRALSQARRQGKPFAVLHLGLNRFKRINESLGHLAGDALLVEVSERLRAAVRNCDFVGRPTGPGEDAAPGINLARWSGDEFVILLTEIRRDQDAARVAERILGDLERPYRLEGGDVALGATVGIALYPNDGDDSAELLKNADAAMHFAKHRDNGGFGYYTPAINEQARLKLSLESDLRRALERDELIPYYQPKVGRDGRVAGAELLLRWRHPERGLVAPNLFIPVAEECGLIVPISERILDVAAAQLRAWLDAGHTGLGLAVNLSPLHLRDPELLNTVRSAIRNHGLPEHALELELTEGMLMDNQEETLSLLGELKSAGARLAIDDFGTGYSSLSYLTRFPIDVLKIDRGFIHDIHANASNMNITRAIIAMAHSLNLEVVAEGVETGEQAEMLWRESCDLIQGYFFGKPMPAEDMTRRLNPPR